MISNSIVFKQDHFSMKRNKQNLLFELRTLVTERSVLLTLWVHSLDGSQFHGGSHAILVFGDDTEQVVLALHDTYTLTLGGGRLDGLPPCVHLSIPPLHNEASEVTSSIVIGVIPVQEDHLASDDHRLQVCDRARDICKGTKL